MHRATCLLIALLLALLPSLARTADTPEANPAEQELQAAWERMLDRLKAAGPQILALDRGDALVAAEGYQYLAMLTGMAIEREQFFQDAARPVLGRGLDLYRKIGLDASDNTYRMVRFEPGGRYLIRGQRGNSRYLGFQLNRGEAAVGNLNDSQMRFEPDGSFAVYLGGEPRPQNWMPLPEGADNLYVREIFIDWASERGSPMWIERLDPLQVPPRPDAAAMAARFDRIASRVERDVAMWESYVSRLRKDRRNSFAVPRATTSQGGSSDNLYAGAYFAIAADEVLLIETDRIDAAFWTVQLGNTWFQSLDYQYRQGSLNSRQATPDPDGRFRIVVSHVDPGYVNWLDTGGRREGVVYYRWNQAAAQPAAPKARVLKLAELPTAMPVDGARIDAAERERRLRERYAEVARRFAL
jgi:hypothetical protein